MQYLREGKNHFPSYNTIAEIAKEKCRDYTTIARWVRRFEEQGGERTGYRRGPGRSGRGPGRPSGTFAEQDAAMVAVASRHPFMPIQDVAAAAGVGDIHVSHGVYAPEKSWAADT